MKYEVKIYIPEYDGLDGRPQPRIFEGAKDRACKIAGGASASYADGVWIPSGSRDILSEPVRILTVIADAAQIAELRELARSVKADLRQESVLFTFVEIAAEFL